MDGGRSVTELLVIEDDPVLRARLGSELAARYPDLPVGIAASAEEAPDVVGDHVPRVVISDLWLPGRSGVDFLVEAAQRWPKTGFVLMSARPPGDLAERNTRGGVRFLAKPFECEDLFVLVDDLLDEQAFSGQIEGVGLVDLLQVLHLGGRSAALWVRRRAARGTIVLERGEVVHAELGPLHGTDAFEEMLSWPAGRFGAVAEPEGGRRTIDMPFHSLLLDALRRVDESKR